jgi:hypothetical protein
MDKIKKTTSLNIATITIDGNKFGSKNGQFEGSPPLKTDKFSEFEKISEEEKVEKLNQKIQNLNVTPDTSNLHLKH